MLELAHIFNEFGEEYHQKFGNSIPPSHLKAMTDIENCRTETLGGDIYQCPECGEFLYSYHSCNNRHCPKCQNDRNEKWLEAQQKLLLNTPYFLSTFTLPEQLRLIARSNQRLIYSILFKTSAAALQKLAADPRFTGGEIGMTGILHTWTRDMNYHPHIHYIIPGGALDETGNWIPSDPNFFVDVKCLSIIFKAKFRDALEKAHEKLFDTIPPKVWKQDWVIHCKPVGDGSRILKYLAPYVFRVAMANSRLVAMDTEKHTVTFKYKPSGSKEWKFMTLDALEFMRRFLQHVLPAGLQKVRYYGLFSSSKKKKLEKIKEQIDPTESQKDTDAQKNIDAEKSYDISKVMKNLNLQLDNIETPLQKTYHLFSEDEKECIRKDQKEIKLRSCACCGAPLIRVKTIQPCHGRDSP